MGTNCRTIAASSDGQTALYGGVKPKIPKIWQIIVIALVAIVFTVVFMSGYITLFDLIWKNDYIYNNLWMIPVLVMIFSLVVGLAQKYLHAPNSIDENLVEAMTGGREPNYRTFPGALLNALASLLSGASIGPEGCLGVLVGQISAWFRSRVKISKDFASAFDLSALASAFNGIIGSAVFTGILATEMGIVTGKTKLTILIWNLLAGAIGYMFCALIGFPSFAGMIPFTPITEITILYTIYAIILGIVGALLAVFAGISMQFFGKLMEKTFKKRVVARALAAGAVIAAVSFFLPELMFSGESQINNIIANFAGYGVVMLLFFAVVKILLLGFSLKSGFLGGPIFPILFSCTMVALALSLVFPGVPLSLLVVCIEASAFALALGVPFTAILLVSVVNTSNAYEIALLVLAAMVGLLMGMALKRLMAQRTANKETTQEQK